MLTYIIYKLFLSTSKRAHTFHRTMKISQQTRPINPHQRPIDTIHHCFRDPRITGCRKRRKILWLKYPIVCRNYQSVGTETVHRDRCGIHRITYCYFYYRQN